jgi:hypothetical protein
MFQLSVGKGLKFWQAPPTAVPAPPTPQFKTKKGIFYPREEEYQGHQAR